MKFTENFKHYLYSLNLMSSIFLMASLPFYFPQQKLALTLFFGTSIIEFFVDQKWKSIKFDKVTWYFIVIGIFFLLSFIYYPFENNHEYFHNLTERRLALLGFSLIGIVGLNKLFKLSYFLNTIILTAIALICYLVFVKIGIAEFITNPAREDLFTQARILNVNSHMAFNLYLNLALASVWYLGVTRFRHIALWIKLIYAVFIVVIIATLLISEGRSGFIAALGLIAIIVIRRMWIYNKRLAFVVSLIILGSMSIVIFQHERMSEKLLEQEPRLFLWKEVALPIIQEKPILGHGTSDGQVQIDKFRIEKQTGFLIELWKNNQRVDVHNQFLQSTIEFGIIGLIILLLIYYAPILIIEEFRMTLLLLFLFLFSWQSLFDAFITGQFAGIFGFIMVLLLKTNKENT